MRTALSALAILACSLAGCTDGGKAREEAEKARAAAEAENAALKKEIADLKAQIAALRGVSGQQPVQSKTGEEEAKVLKVAKAFVEDLEKGRFASAYRDTSSAYQKKTPQKAFEQLWPVAREEGGQIIPGGLPGQREEKIRNLGKDKAYEYYLTCTLNFRERVLTLLLIEEESAWKVEQFTITERQR